MALTGPAETALASLDVSMPASLQADSTHSISPGLAKLTKAAGEFESILLASLWKSMKETFADPEEDADPTMKSFDEWGIQAMASAVGNAGGFGIKNLIIKYLEPQLSGGGNAVPPAK